MDEWKIFALCNECGHHFRCSDGNMSSYHLFRCELCGREGSLTSADTGIPLSIYNEQGKKQTQPDESVLNAEQSGDNSSPNPAEDLLSLSQKLDRIAGFCDCGGHFRLIKPVKCPSCGSTDILEAGERAPLHYDLS